MLIGNTSVSKRPLVHYCPHIHELPPFVGPVVSVGKCAKAICSELRLLLHPTFSCKHWVKCYMPSDDLYSS